MEIVLFNAQVFKIAKTGMQKLIFISRMTAKVIMIYSSNSKLHV
jgi:hypothetical protein